VEKPNQLYCGAEFDSEQEIYDLLPEGHEVVVIHDRKAGKVRVYSRTPETLNVHGLQEILCQTTGAIFRFGFNNVSSVVKFTQMKVPTVRVDHPCPINNEKQPALV
jgi:hypothetical protein